jgi:uncharacterized protein (TIGR03435 family)
MGSWHGTAQGPQGQTRKVVFKISKADNQALAAVIYSVEPAGPPINAASVTLAGSNLKIAIPAIGGDYEGKLSADGNSIAGAVKQGADALELNLTRETPETAWVIPEPPPPPKPMAADADPSFEVATIKPANPDRPGRSILFGQGGMLTTTNTTLNDLIIFAYEIHPDQLTGGASWMATDKYDIAAKPDQEGAPNATQLRTMMRKLLAERFKLAFHREKKELSAFMLTVGKDGVKMARNESGGTLPGFGGRGPGAIGVRNTTMEEFAGFLQARIVDRPVVDQTGLGASRFDFTLSWRPDQLTPPPPDAPPPPADLESRPDLFTAMQEQLGLKFEAVKTAVDVLAVDKVERASEN